MLQIQEKISRDSSKHLVIRVYILFSWGLGLKIRLGIAVVPGSIIWHAMRLGSVQAYVDSNPEGPRTVAGKVARTC